MGENSWRRIYGGCVGAGEKRFGQERRENEIRIFILPQRAVGE